MSLSITGPDAHVCLLRLPVTAEDGLAEAPITLKQGACHPDPPCEVFLCQERRERVPYCSGHGER